MDKFNMDDIKSGFIVECRNGVRFMCVRVGQFTKAFINSNNKMWKYASAYKGNKYISHGIAGAISDPNYDIEKVFGLINDSLFYASALDLDTEHRELIWSERKQLNLTMEQLCKMLNADVHIVEEEKNG